MNRLHERTWRCLCRSTPTASVSPARRARVGHLAGALALGAGLALGGASAEAQTYQRLIGTQLEESPRSQNPADGGASVITSGLLRRNTAAGGPLDDMFISKVRVPPGLEIWTTQIGGPQADIGLDARELRSAEHILLGHSATTPAPLNMTLTKLDPLGNVLWTRIYMGAPTIYTQWPRGGTVREMLAPVGAPVGSPGDLGVATGNPNLSPRTRAQFVRTDPFGAPLFNNTYFDIRFPDGGEHAFADWRELPDRSIVCVGTITEQEQPIPGGPFVSRQRILLARLTPGGAVIWARTYSYLPTGAGESVRTQQGRGVDLAAGATEIVVSASLETIDGAGVSTDHMQYLRTDLAGNPLSYKTYKSLYVAPVSLRSIHTMTTGLRLIHANLSRNVLPAVAPPLPSPVVPPVSPTGPAGLMLIDPLGNPIWANSYSPLTLTTDDQAAVGSDGFNAPGFPAGFLMLAKKTIGHGYDVAPNMGDMMVVRTDATGRTTCLTEPMPIGVDMPQLRLGEVPFQWVNEPVSTFWQFTVTHPNFLDTRYTCPGDYTADCVINFADLNEVLAFFGPRYGFGDLNLVLGNFGGGC